MKKILLAEDEEELARATGTILKLNQYDVTIVNNGKEAINKLKGNNYDVIILDIMMPVMDGISALKEMRKTGVNTPVILLTAKSQTDDKVEGLDSGANDYLTKPFESKELFARIRALTRKEDERTQSYKFGNVIFDKQEKQLSNGNSELHLNNEEGKIMEILVKNKEQDIDIKELKTKVIENAAKGEINLYVGMLQQKLETLGSEQNIQMNKNNISLK